MNQLLVPKNQSGIHLKTFLMQWGLSASLLESPKKSTGSFCQWPRHSMGYTAFSQ